LNAGITRHSCCNTNGPSTPVGVLRTNAPRSPHEFALLSRSSPPVRLDVDSFDCPSKSWASTRFNRSRFLADSPSSYNRSGPSRQPGVEVHDVHGVCVDDEGTPPGGSVCLCIVHLVQLVRHTAGGEPAVELRLVGAPDRRPCSQAKYAARF
jgi:hypothetical protein